MFERHETYRVGCATGDVTDRTDRIAAMTKPALTRWTRTLLALLFAVATTAAVAQDRPRRQGQPPSQQQQTTSEQSVLRLLPPDAVTQHTIDTPAGKLDYPATAGTLSLFDQS